MAYLTRDTWIGLIMLIVATVYWMEADKIRISPLDGPVGASGLPKSLAYALGALAVILILRSVAGAYLARKAELPTKPPKAEEPLAERLAPHIRAIGMIGIGIVYLLLIPYFGYLVMITALILAVSLYIGAPLGLRTLLVSVLGGIGFRLLFVEFLDIPLPEGALIEALLSGAG